MHLATVGHLEMIFFLSSQVRHELKEMQRKAEVDLDLRKKAEAERAEIRKRLEDETNKRTREQNNNHHVSRGRKERRNGCPKQESPKEI